MSQGQEIYYLTLDDVIRIYANALSLDLPDARDLLRDQAGLEGALARPASHARYGAADLPQQAAVLAHGIAEGQYFIEGNKRTALVAMLTFLEVNGLTLGARQQDLAQWIIDLAEVGISSDQKIRRFAERLRAAVTPGD